MSLLALANDQLLSIWAHALAGEVCAAERLSATCKALLALGRGNLAAPHWRLHLVAFFDDALPPILAAVQDPREALRDTLTQARRLSALEAQQLTKLGHLLLESSCFLWG